MTIATIKSKPMRFFLEALGSVAIPGMTLFYGLLHLGFGVDLRDLTVPFVAFTVLQVAFLFAYWTFDFRERLRRGDTFLFLISLMVYFIIGMGGIAYFAWKRGSCDKQDAVELWIIGIVTICVAFPVVNCIWKKRHSMSDQVW